MKLYLEPDDPLHAYTFIRPLQTIETLPGLRLITFADVRQHVTDPAQRVHAIQKCLIDTGSFLSIIPQRIAQHLDLGTVTRLPFHATFPARLRVLVIAGVSVPYELGETSARIRDKDGRFLNIRFIAKFSQDNGKLNVPLTLGLRGGFLDGRKLQSTPDPAAPFGESWTLEDP